ncbi:hypothetical protein CVIRNUC_006073 [Coccomyxa viridis]|uniref:Extracellular protein n=1 Tax=Coccomyxa viridis TaxID=1274662 RepID=A0AAV1IAL9_9CHLO|nr:hypothetical protein CVIRNUC_006073 [Coccomyxa viridis]
MGTFVSALLLMALAASSGVARDLPSDSFHITKHDATRKLLQEGAGSMTMARGRGYRGTPSDRSPGLCPRALPGPLRRPGPPGLLMETGPPGQPARQASPALLMVTGALAQGLPGRTRAPRLMRPPLPRPPLPLHRVGSEARHFLSEKGAFCGGCRQASKLSVWTTSPDEHRIQ